MHHQFIAQCINTAHAANNRGEFAQAIGWCKQALQLAPDLPEAWYNLGLAFAGMGDRSEALNALEQVRIRTQNSANAQNSLGLQFMGLGAEAEAEQCLARALALAPDYAFAHSNLGTLRERQKRLKDAETAFRRAIELQPALAPAYVNLGGILNLQKNYERAEAACRKAIELAPQLPGAWSNLGNALTHLFRTEEAEAACRQALALDPDLPQPHSALAQVYLAKGDFQQAFIEFEHAYNKDPADTDLLSSKIFCLNYLPDVTPEQMLTATRPFDLAIRKGIAPFNTWLCSPDRQRKLRIGMISGDFRRHPVGYFLKGPLGEIDESGFELVAYSNHPKEDALTAELRACCAAWRNVFELSDTALARRIQDDRIDILIDLSGHTEYNRLSVFARKPAPVQVTWLGYFATTGVREIDWKIGDPWLAPEHESGHFSERIWRLPESSFCFSPISDAPPVAASPCHGNGYITYGCFNNLAKINDEVIRLWSRILDADSESKLLIKSSQLAGRAQREGLLTRFERVGIRADRLMLEAAGPYDAYLNAYARVDLVLDTFPYPGGTTTCEGLWMGVPVVTLRGDRFIAHQGESLLNAAGLSEWIAADRDDYVRIALRSAADQDGLARLRADMRGRLEGSPLFDARRFARHLETAWRGMWQAWCDSHGLDD